jgi:hypothetical protein
MNFRRTNLNAVLLPDGTILVIGGQRAGKWAADPQPVLQPEIYDPHTNHWTLMAPMQYPKQYHSVAVLLPDGRVWAAGGIDPTLGSPPARDQRHAEMFTPPYLLRGAQPTVTSVPSTIAYGAAFDVHTPDSARIASVALLRPIATTHHTDAGQRYIKLPITGRTSNRVSTALPAMHTIAPPGYYLLFIVDSNGVPSVGQFVHIS